MQPENFANSPIGLKRGGKPSCGIFALCYVTNKSVEEIFLSVKTTFRKKGRWAGSTTVQQRDMMMKKLGIKTKVLKSPRHSLKSFMRDMAHISFQAPLMVRTHGHVQIVHNGKVIDQTGVYDVQDFWGKNKVVTDVRRIENMGQGKDVPLIKEKAAPQKISIDHQAKRQAHAIAQHEKWKRKAAAAAKLEKKWLKKVRYYDKVMNERQGV